MNEDLFSSNEALTFDDLLIVPGYTAERWPATIRREELDAMRRHLRVTATLLPHLSNLDDPGWGPAHEEYERSWDEIHRAMERDAAPSR